MNVREQPSRLALVGPPTLVHPLDALARHLGRPVGSLLIKRDDLIPFGFGGNKVRKMEFELAAARRAGATCLVSGGGVQTNAGRVVAAGAASAGLDCVLVLNGEPTEPVSGNRLLAQVLGARLEFVQFEKDDELEAAIEECGRRLRDTGVVTHTVPVGISSPLGVLGSITCADEIRRQVPSVDLLVCATGSAGTQAGLAVGMGCHDQVLGVRVGTRPQLGERVERLASDAAHLAGRASPTGTCRLDEDQLGDGYGAHTPEAMEAIALLARLEGVLLDPVYTGKAMAALLAGCRDGRIDRTETVVFVHTGGAPGLLSSEHGSRVAAAVAR